MVKGSVVITNHVQELFPGTLCHHEVMGFEADPDSHRESFWAGSAHQWSVTLPESTAGLEGESVILDCSFSYPDPPNKPYTIWGQWFKGNPCNERAEKIYESNESNNRIKLTGNLTKKNCSIEISDLRKTDTGHYCFRFEIPGFDKWTGKLSISVDVYDRPGNPTVFPSEVAEGISTTLTCTSSNVVTQVKPKLTWEGITELTDQKTVNKEKQSLSDRKITSSFTFVPSYQHHLKLIKCVVSCANYQCSKQSNITLQVKYAPRNTTIQINEPLDIIEGSENVTLTCSTDSYPQATHTWYKTKRHTNTTQTLNSTGSVLLFKTISRMDFGTFTCVVNNSQGNDTSAADINVKYAPRNTTIQINEPLDIIEGRENVTLTCSTDCYPQATHTWYKTKRHTNTTQTLNSTGSVLLFKTISRMDSGTFTCVVNNSQGNDTSAADINVKYPPRNTTIQINKPLDIIEGRENVTLTCSTDSYPQATHTWYKTKRHTNTTQTLNSTGSVLLFKTISRMDSGTFTCVVNNSQGNDTSAADINVKYAPRNTTIQINEPLDIIEGRENVTLTCSTDSYPQATHTWYKTKRDTNTTQTLNSTGSVLLFKTISRRDSGTFTCVVNNSQGNDTAAADINVKYPPRNTTIQINKPLDIIEGRENVTLTCSTVSYPQATHTWYKTKSHTNTTQTLNSTGSVLLFKTISRMDSGTFTCVVNNSQGNDTSAADINVKYAPQNTTIQINKPLDIIEGRENVTLTCSTDSYPQATHTWYKTKRHTNTTQTLKSTGSVLLFKTISRRDFGTFTCVVNNSQGNDTSAADINVKYGPSEINISQNGLNYKCVTDANPPATIIWNLTESMTKKTSQIHENKSTNSLEVQGLESFCVSCRAENEYGRVYSRESCSMSKQSWSAIRQLIFVGIGVIVVFILLLTVVLVYCIKQLNQRKQMENDSQAMMLHEFPNSIQDHRLIEQDNKHKEDCGYENFIDSSESANENLGDNSLHDSCIPDKPEQSKAAKPDEEECIYSNIKDEEDNKHKEDCGYENFKDGSEPAKEKLGDNLLHDSCIPDKPEHSKAAKPDEEECIYSNIEPKEMHGGAEPEEECMQPEVNASQIADKRDSEASLVYASICFTKQPEALKPAEDDSEKIIYSSLRVK
ncbi:hemicentin-1-like [Callorhinchus milii]|uniref:hemicentin-1-like n=1 Tax=Callorhinchus milii TaxID=7868 RepID=UPI001C3FCA62|nr:hemicentin-1-like [Callorhinchus milii]